MLTWSIAIVLCVVLLKYYVSDTPEVVVIEKDVALATTTRTSTAADFTTEAGNGTGSCAYVDLMIVPKNDANTETCETCPRIRIKLRPEIGGRPSVDYLCRLAHRMKGKINRDAAECVPDGPGSCFYRNERGLLLQGKFDPTIMSEMAESKGPCPSEDAAQVYETRTCFEHDPNCGCHGPMMTQGDVAWAAGKGKGPDFFIYTMGGEPMRDWGHDHTVFGEVDLKTDAENIEAMKMITSGRNIPRPGMKLLREKVYFTLRPPGA